MVKLEQEMLQAVEKPARYTGGEWNAQPKDSAAVLCRIALAMADVYEVGMSNLGLKILYEILNRRDDIAAERVYAPWLDMEEEMRRRGIPLFSLETFREISSFDILGFSLQYELLITNTLNMLDLAGLPIHAAERRDFLRGIVGKAHGVRLRRLSGLHLRGEGDGQEAQSLHGRASLCGEGGF